MANTAWNPSDKSAGITLSNVNLTAKNVDNAVDGVRAVVSQSGGKYYWEQTCTTFTGTRNCAGMAILSYPLTSLGDSSSGISGNCVISRLGPVIVNGGTSLTVGGVGGQSVNFGTIANGAVVCIAIDLTAKLAWFRLGAAGAWNNSAGRDPAAGTGGVSCPSLGGGVAAYPCAAVCNTNDLVTANFGDSTFVGAVPSGFTAGWPTTPPPPIELAGNLGGASQYGKLSYGVSLYSRIGAFAPVFAADLTIAPTVNLAGNLTPTVMFGPSALRKLVGLTGGMAPVVTFGPSLLTTPQNLAGGLAPIVALAANMSVVYAVTGNLAPQAALGASLTGDWLLAGDMRPSVAFAGQVTSGPLWDAASPCPSSAWTETDACPPTMWTPVAPPQWQLPGTPGGYGLGVYGLGPYNWQAVSDATPWEPAELCEG